MPRASRRRRRPPGRGFGQLFLIGCAATVTIVLVAGSMLAVHTQSSQYRSSVTSGYSVMAQKVATASTHTGAALATALSTAPDLVNQAFPFSARGVLEQDLDVAVRASAAQAAQADHLAPPSAEGGMSTQFASVMKARSVATANIRATIDQLLGLSPLPIAGAAAGTLRTSEQTTLISAGQAATNLTKAGADLASADAAYRSMMADARAAHLPFRLPPSAWVIGPAATAPLGPSGLAATASALASSSALVPFHHLVITTTGLVPIAVPTGAPGVTVTSCVAPVSVAATGTPTIVPPTRTLAVDLTVTNCGTVDEVAVPVVVNVVPADLPGSPVLPNSGSGGRVRATVTMLPGASAAPTLGAVPVTPGHRYRVTASVSVPVGQADATGSTQDYLVQVAA